ncbi:hypothetical protein Aau02nite_63540 [Amorphoplanes auranticolor]|uniref:Uncharacterized protein n=2 Tax=Actinoplanes auranticolor TaxID=47988 RepID=A0A919SLG9_9ACTN|nr:hypothetical protein Aau02nite_63540 [Actinoplanes auranticolor]
MGMVIRILAFALIVTASLLVATWAGFLVWLEAGRVSPAILSAAGAFGATFGLGLGIYSSL